MKKIAICLVLVILCVLPVSAADLPDGFWKVNPQYLAAIDAMDNLGIIEHGEKTMGYMASYAQNSDVISVSASRTYEVANAYDRLGNYQKAREWYIKFIPFGETMGFTDAVDIANVKAFQYETNLDLYQTTYNTTWFSGHKNENEVGVLYGLSYDSPTMSEIPDHSMILMYHEFGEELNLFREGFLQRASEQNRAVEFALNLPGEGSQLHKVLESRDYIMNLVNVFNKYQNIPIYLRFGAEMNCWSGDADRELYKQAFRFVADIIKSNTPHVAMVYSINFVSSWGVNFDDFYPGDQYVDWVGVSLYCVKNFNGTATVTETDKLNNLLFFAGDAADPVKIMSEIVSTFSTKPIMIAESGAAHHTRALGEESAGWAIQNLRKIISYVPMVYPQVKLIAYFDTEIDVEHTDFALTSNYELKQEYLSLVKANHLIQGNCYGDNVSGFIHRSDDFTLSKQTSVFHAYVHSYSSAYETVNYFIDGGFAASSSVAPYTAAIDFSNVPAGVHTLRVEATDSLGNRFDKSFNVTVEDYIKINLNGNVLQGLDQPPVLVNERTMVPLRAIFEALGATVDWNDNTKTAVAIKDNLTLTVQLGNKNMKKNTENIYLEVSPKNIGGRTMVPLRAISEALGAVVDWDNETKTVLITSN